MYDQVDVSALEVGKLIVTLGDTNTVTLYRLSLRRDDTVNVASLCMVVDDVDIPLMIT